MTFPFEGNAVIYCEAVFGTTNGKTAHGLIRRSRRYRISSVIDSTLAGKDAGIVMDGKSASIPIMASLQEALDFALRTLSPLNYFIVGIAPDGGKLRPHDRDAVRKALEAGLNVDSGLHDYLSNDAGLIKLAEDHGVNIRDIRKPPPPEILHFFSGKIEQVDSLKIAVLGTDSAVGKRTTAWILADNLNARGVRTEMIGTGQTAWLQGARYGIILDSLVNDFVSGEIEHAVWSAWTDLHPEVIIIEGQGSLMNPAYPGGFEILAAGRPDIVILQHPPARKEYDGFPGYSLHPIEKQIKVIELLSSKPVVAVTVNHEKIKADDIDAVCRDLSRRTGRPVFDVLQNGPEKLSDLIQSYLKKSSL